MHNALAWEMKQMRAVFSSEPFEELSCVFCGDRVVVFASIRRFPRTTMTRPNPPGVVWVMRGYLQQNYLAIDNGERKREIVCEHIRVCVYVYTRVRVCVHVFTGLWTSCQGRQTTCIYWSVD